MLSGVPGGALGHVLRLAGPVLQKSSSVPDSTAEIIQKRREAEDEERCVRCKVQDRGQCFYFVGLLRCEHTKQGVERRVNGGTR